MRKNIILILIWGIAVVFTACEDFLEESPSGSLPSDEAITTVKDLNNAVNGVYTGMIDFDLGLGNSTESFSYYGGNFIAYADLKGGDLNYTASNNQISPMGRFEHNAESPFAEQFWQMPYTLAGRVNDILSVIDAIEVDSDEVERYNDLKGQLYALRALLHFDLARLFAKLPSITDVNEPDSGIPLSDEKLPVDHEPVRTTLKETYDFIKSDFNAALELLSREENTGRINYWAAKGLLARVHLYLEENNEALAAAQDIISNSPYSLYSREEYLTVWDKEGTSESIFEVLTNTSYNSQRNSIGYYSHSAGYGETAMSEQGYQVMTQNPDDIRGQLIEWEEDEADTQGFYIQKYPGRDGDLYLNNPRIIRLSEVYLIAAEAKVKGGTASGDQSAAGYINQLRRQRIANYTDVAAITLDDVLTERRIELMAEGHRNWDAWRNEKSVFSPRLNQEIDGHFERAILPIPKRERDISPALAQNPGY
ncbi:MAG: RagB/SusD family nutrient uptake outer membrane protein [Mariniphaga sp.]